MTTDAGLPGSGDGGIGVFAGSTTAGRCGADSGGGAGLTSGAAIAGGAVTIGAASSTGADGGAAMPFSRLQPLLDQAIKPINK